MAEGEVKRDRQRIRRWLLATLVLAVVMLGFWLSWKWTLSQPQKNPYSSEDFEYDQKGFLTCKTSKSMLGIDVSRHQGDIDWQKVKEAGVEFAFIRVGYRSMKDHLMYEDDLARVNLEGAREAGIQVGAYFFSQALTEAEARSEAEFVTTILKDYQLDLPVAFDWETTENPDTQTITKDQLTACIKSFCTVIEEAGYESMIYFNEDHGKRLIDTDALSGYKIWFAYYGSFPNAPCKPDYWQYTNQGTIPGIEEKVDINLYLP